jgi:diacylglycerol O-acyltransferase / wax synthase
LPGPGSYRRADAPGSCRRHDCDVARTRLTSLDSSFLRVETPNAHMHVAWTGVFDPHPVRPRPAVASLRVAVAVRLRHVPRFRQRLAFPPLAVAEPSWVDDPGFDVANHVVELETAASRPRRPRLVSAAGEPLPFARFRALADELLSRPLDRARPLWQIALAPELEGGQVGVVCRIHHALVDGKSAVELALLLLDASPDAEPGEPDDWEPAPPPGAARLALDAMVDGAGEGLRAAGGLARLARSPRRGAGRIADTLRHTALAVEADLLRPAPSSFVNPPIGPRRTLLRARAPVAQLLAIREASGTTLNDVCLAAVAGAMRDLSLSRRELPGPLKAMVPVSVRGEGEREALGNRISFAFVELPAQLRSPTERLARVHEQTAAFKRDARPAGTEMLLGALGMLPAPLKDAAARAAASPRIYNLTVSNVPGPRVPVYMLGAELAEVHPVVPIPEGHALAIGIFTYRDNAFFGIHADPEALPEVNRLPAALSAAILALDRSTRRGALPAVSAGAT